MGKRRSIAPSGRTTWMTSTQGSAKPPPWAKFVPLRGNKRRHADTDCSAVHCFPTELQKRETDPCELDQFLGQRLGLHHLVGERPPDVKRFVLQIIDCR